MKVTTDQQNSGDTLNNRNYIVTQQTGNGPLLALDFTTIPDELKLRILLAASQIANDVGMGYVAAEEDGPECAQEGLNELCQAFNEVDKLYQPTVPGADLYGSAIYTKEYPVYRNGFLINVPRAELSPVELSATIQRMKSDSRNLAQHAEDLGSGSTTHFGASQ